MAKVKQGAILRHFKIKELNSLVRFESRLSFSCLAPQRFFLLRKPQQENIPIFAPELKNYRS
jgi:hypothetical protein